MRVRQVRRQKLLNIAQVLKGKGRGTKRPFPGMKLNRCRYYRVTNTDSGDDGRRGDYNNDDDDDNGNSDRGSDKDSSGGGNNMLRQESTRTSAQVLRTANLTPPRS